MPKDPKQSGAIAILDALRRGRREAETPDYRFSEYKSAVLYPENGNDDLVKCHIALSGGSLMCNITWSSEGVHHTAAFAVDSKDAPRRGADIDALIDVLQWARDHETAFRSGSLDRLIDQAEQAALDELGELDENDGEYPEIRKFDTGDKESN